LRQRLHFISPDRPAVKARMTPALLFLQEIAIFFIQKINADVTRSSG